MSLIEDKGIYNPLVKKQVRKDTFGEDSHEFYDPGKPGLEKFIFFFLKHGFMAFLTQTVWLGLEFQDFKEDGIKSVLTIDSNSILALFLIIKKTYLLYLQGIMQK